MPYMEVQVGKTYIINTAPSVWFKGKVWRNAPRVITRPTTPWDDERGDWAEHRTREENKWYEADGSVRFYQLPGAAGPVEEASVEGAARGKRHRRKKTRKGAKKSRRTTRRR